MPSNVKQPTKELGQLFARSTKLVANGMLEIARAVLEKDGDAELEASEDLGDTIVGAMGLSDMLGRRRALLESDAAASRGESKRGAQLMIVAREEIHTLYHDPSIHRKIPTGPSPVVPSVTFKSAVEDIVERQPRLASGAEAVSEVYSSEHGFALARSNTLEITKRVQKAVADSIAKGVTVVDAEKILLSIGNWTRAYAETVYRTNISTAYSAGRWQQFADPDIAEVMPAAFYDAVEDSNTRPNHRAADGLIAATNDPIWNVMSPPLGYNCRCAIRGVSIFELERKGLVEDGKVTRFVPAGFGAAHPDKGFGGGRPDRAIYG